MIGLKTRTEEEGVWRCTYAKHINVQAKSNEKQAKGKRNEFNCSSR